MQPRQVLRNSFFTLFGLIVAASLVLAFVVYQLASHKEVSLPIAAVVTGLVGVSAVFGLILVSKIIHQLQTLQSEAQSFANGDLARKITIKSNDEIGQLAATFNQMAQRLRESYQRLTIENRRNETMLESMGEGMIAIDKNGDIVLINNKALELLELEENKELVGTPINKVVTLFTVDPEAKEIPLRHRPEMKVLHSSKDQGGIFAYRPKKGKAIQINVTASPVIMEGKNIGAIIILRDVTVEREVDRMKTEFISLASHQLRTPLSSIKWFSEMLLAGDAGKLTTEQKDFAQNIYDSSERMIDLVSALLNISRIESGRIVIDPQLVDLHDLVSAIVNDLQAKIAERQQNLIISVHKGLPKIMLDPHLIGQVYLNLLTNAIKYTPKGGEITVFVSRKSNHIVSQVTDNGYGIPKAQQKKVFQKFFRAENAVKVETDGTGLGLYLIKSIVETSGGKIWFESEEGKGTTFWFSLPISGMKPKAGEVTLD